MSNKIYIYKATDGSLVSTVDDVGLATAAAADISLHNRDCPPAERRGYVVSNIYPPDSHKLENGQWIEIPRPKNVDEVVSEKLAAIERKKNEVLNAGVQFKSWRFQVDERSLLLISTTADMLQDQLLVPDDFFWRSVDNTNVAFSREDIGTLRSLAARYVSKTYSRYFYHKDEVRRLRSQNASAAEIDAYSIDSGWPS